MNFANLAGLCIEFLRMRREEVNVHFSRSGFNIIS